MLHLKLPGEQNNRMVLPGNFARVAGRLKWVEKRPVSWLVGHIARHGLGAGTDVHFFVDMLQMAAHRFHADGQLVGDFLVGIALGEQNQNLLLARAQVNGRIWATCSRRGMTPPRAGRFRSSSARRRAARPASPSRKSAGLVRFNRYPSAPACKRHENQFVILHGGQDQDLGFGSSSSLRRAVHSMPDMRGKKISISTTSGANGGNHPQRLLAGGADAHAGKSRQRIDELRPTVAHAPLVLHQDHLDGRFGGVAGGVGGWVRFHPFSEFAGSGRRLLTPGVHVSHFDRRTVAPGEPRGTAARMVQRHGELHQAAAARLAGHAENSPPISLIRWSCWSCRSVPRRPGAGSKPLPLSSTDDDQLLVFAVNAQEQFAGLRMFGRVVQRLFHRQKQIAPHRQIKGVGRESPAPRPAGTGLGVGSKNERVFADVIRKIAERVAPGIDGPHRPRPAHGTSSRACSQI